MISKEMTIEDLVRAHPKSVRYLMEKGIKCLACGEPVWGTLESSAKDKGFDEDQVIEIVNELNQFLEEN